MALMAGALIPLSLAPFNFWPCVFIAPVLLYWTTERCSISRVMIRFYLFNIALFGFGISWIFVPIHVYGGAPVLLAGFLVALFVVAYAVVCLPLAYIYARFFRYEWWVSALSFCALWVLQEWFRSWFLTGLGWLFAGYGVMETPLSSYAPIVGVFGLSLIVLVCAMSLYQSMIRRNLLFVIPVILLAATFALQQIAFTKTDHKITVSLVQGNVDQHSKWLVGNRIPIINRYLDATEDEWGRDLIVWPEAALTLFHEQASPYLDIIDLRAKRAGSTLLLGIPDRDAQGGFQNTVIALGEGEGQYVKQRLVPFGEYVPLENYLRGLIQLFDLPMSRNKAGDGDQSPLSAGSYTLSTSICYEVVYPDLVRAMVRDPDLLVTVSNDTWFGHSIGPWQHLQMARMRALENGRAMARATNNGVTALIDHRGNVLASLPQFEQGVLRGELEIRQGRTPFQRFGSLPTVLLCLLAVILAGCWRWIRNSE